MSVKSLVVGSSYLHMRCISIVYRSSSLWRSSGQGQAHRSQKGRKFLFSQCKTSIGNNSCSMKHRAVMFACSMGFTGTVDWMVWLLCLSRDWKWPCVTKCTHSWLVGLRLEHNLVLWTFYLSIFCELLLQLWSYYRVIYRRQFVCIMCVCVQSNRVMSASKTGWFTDKNPQILQPWLCTVLCTG